MASSEIPTTEAITTEATTTEAITTEATTTEGPLINSGTYVYIYRAEISGKLAVQQFYLQKNINTAPPVWIMCILVY